MIIYEHISIKKNILLCKPESFNKHDEFNQLININYANDRIYKPVERKTNVILIYFINRKSIHSSSCVFSVFIYLY